MSIKKILVLLMILALSTSILVGATKPKLTTLEFDLVEINDYKAWEYGVFSEAYESEVGDLEVTMLVDADADTEGVMFDVFIRGSEIKQTVGPVDFKADTYTTINVVLDVPSDFPLGEHTVRIEVSEGCGQGIMNLPVIFTETVEPESELQIKSTIIVPPTVGPKEEILVTTVLQNTGEKDIEDIEVEFEIENLELADDVNIPLIPAGASATVEVSFDIPDDAEEGNEELKVTAEYEQKQISRDFSFNIVTDNPSTKSGKLKIARAVLLSEAVSAGDIIEALVNVENTGGRELDDVEVTISVIELGYLRSMNLGDIEGGDEETVLVPLDVPLDSPAGPFTVRISARSDDDRRVVHRDIEII